MTLSLPTLCFSSPDEPKAQKHVFLGRRYQMVFGALGFGSVFGSVMTKSLMLFFGCFSRNWDRKHLLLSVQTPPQIYQGIHIRSQIELSAVRFRHRIDLFCRLSTIAEPKPEYRDAYTYMYLDHIPMVKSLITLRRREIHACLTS
jgi:hypothetical protein